MVAEYKSKWEKFQVTKQQVTDEQKSVREMERVVDVELFLGLQERWAEDSPPLPGHPIRDVQTCGC